MAEKTSQSGIASSGHASGQASRAPPSRAPSKRTVSGQSKLTAFSGGQWAAIPSATAAMPAWNARRAPRKGWSGSSTTANSRRSKRPTCTKVPAPDFAAIPQAWACAFPRSRKATSV
jgi:hypothetical protein